jgi:hypothetical protein
MRSLALLAVLATVSAAQDLAAAAARLAKGSEPARALAELRAAGPEGFAAVFDAFDRAGGSEELARALADLGSVSRSAIPRLLAAIPVHAEPLRSHLLRALANGALVADTESRDAIAAALPGMLEAGLVFSPSADAPSLAWYEYVRLRRRLSLGTDGSPRLIDSLNQLAADRGIRLPGPGPGGALPIHDLNAYGSHGQRELLEGIAERTLAASDREAVLELARYLAHETPRPGIVLTESQAGIGEPAPDVPAAKFPTLWRRDDWRFACAHAVFALHPDAAVRAHALQHLLFGDDVTLRIEAIEAVRRWPQPWDAFAVALAACVESGDRAVVREALVTLGLDGAPAGVAMDAIGRLAVGADAELAAIAQRLLRARVSGAAPRCR